MRQSTQTSTGPQAISFEDARRQMHRKRMNDAEFEAYRASEVRLRRSLAGRLRIIAEALDGPVGDVEKAEREACFYERDYASWRIVRENLDYERRARAAETDGEPPRAA